MLTFAVLVCSGRLPVIPGRCGRSPLTVVPRSSLRFNVDGQDLDLGAPCEAPLAAGPRCRLLHPVGPLEARAATWAGTDLDRLVCP